MLLLGRLAIVGFLLLSACTPDTPASDVSTTSTNNPSQSTPSTNETTITKFASKDNYYHLKGTLSNLNITMELFEYKTEEIGQRFFRGFYHYDRYGGPIALYGNLDANGKLNLTEQSSWEKDSHEFEGQWNASNGFSGQWRNGNGKDVHSFNLQHSQEGTVQLRTVTYQDSLVIFPEWPSSPIMNYEAEWLSPSKTGLSSTQQQFLEKSIAQGLFNTPNNTNTTSLQQALQADFQELAIDFKEEMQLMRKDGMLDSLSSESYLSYSYSSSMQVYHNQAPLLTVGYTDYSYTGGAHGMYATQVASYELSKMRKLELNDILKPGYEERVSEVLADALRNKYRLEDSESLSSILFEDTIAPNQNFGITDKGIFFVYTPYEVAPYAVGEFELFVSFEKIQEFVREEWL